MAIKSTLINLCLAAAIVVTGITGCEEVVYFDVDAQDNRLVINSVITPDEVAVASVSLSTDPLAVGFEATRIDDATVTLYKNESLAGVFYHTGDGTYSLDAGLHDVSPGDNLRLEVSAPGYTSVSATTSIPAMVPILSVSIIDTTFESISYSVVDSLGNVYFIDTLVPYYQIALTFTDVPGENHYSLLVAYQDAFSYANACITTQDPVFGLEDEYVASNIDEEGEATICEEVQFPDFTFEGKTKTIVMDIFAIETSFATDPSFIFTLSNLSEEYYQYKKTSGMQAESQGNPFSEPVVVFTNIENGFGIFAGVSRSVITLPL